MNFHTKQNTTVTNASILVYDLEGMSNFYTDVIGFDIINEKPNKVMLGVDNKVILTLITHKNVIKKTQATQGLYHIAYLLPTRESLARVLYNLMIKQIKIDGMSDHGVSEAIYVNDPENNGIELYVDKAVSEWPIENDQINMYTDHLNMVSLLSTVKTPGFEGLDKNTILGHMHFSVKEITKPTKFFVGLLNLQVKQNLYDTALFVSSNNYHHHIAFNIWSYNAKDKAENETGLISYTVETSKAEFEDIKANFTAENYAFEEHDNLLITKDSNNVEVIIKANI